MKTNELLELASLDAMGLLDPNERDAILRLTDHLQSDELFLFSTDYPHWQFDGDSALPEGLPDRLFRKIACENALATYKRLARADRPLEATP